MKKNMLKKGFYRTQGYLKHNSATILTCMGALGVVATSVTAVKVTPKAIKLLDEARKDKEDDLTKIEVICTAGPLYIPSILIGVTTITCIFSANVLNKRKQAALTSAYAYLNTSYNEYRNKVNQLFGEEADCQVRESIMKDKYNEENGGTRSDDKMTFFDQFSGRYFESTRADVQAAEYHFNRNFALRGYSELNELYQFLGLAVTEEGSALGWSSYQLWEEFDAGWIDFDHELVNMDDGMECYVIKFTFDPVADYMDY